MEKQDILDKIDELAEQSKTFIENISAGAGDIAPNIANVMTNDAVVISVPFVYLFTAFVMACFVGYYVVWSVTPALHSPLMGVTNAISSVIIVGALIAAGSDDISLSKIFGFIAVVLASINIFGGFVVTNRMLSMFKRKIKAKE